MMLSKMVLFVISLVSIIIAILTIDMPMLQTITFYTTNFQNANNFTISSIFSLYYTITDLPKLQKLSFGNFCFKNVWTFDLSGIAVFILYSIDLPELQSVNFGFNCFMTTSNVRISSILFNCVFDYQ